MLAGSGTDAGGQLPDVQVPGVNVSGPVPKEKVADVTLGVPVMPDSENTNVPLPIT